MIPKPVSLEAVVQFAETRIPEMKPPQKKSKLRKQIAKARDLAGALQVRGDEPDGWQETIEFLRAIPGDGNAIQLGHVYLSFGKPEAPPKSRAKPKPPQTMQVVIPQSEPIREDIEPRETLASKCLRYQDLAGWIDLKLRTRPPEKVLWDDCVAWLRQEPRIKAMQPDELMIVLSVVKGFIHAS